MSETAEAPKTKPRATTSADADTLALSTNPAGVAAVRGGVQALPNELDDEQDTPEHRQDLQEGIGSTVNDDGTVPGTESEVVPDEDLAPNTASGVTHLQKYPAWPGGPLV